LNATPAIKASGRTPLAQREPARQACLFRNDGGLLNDITAKQNCSAKA